MTDDLYTVKMPHDSAEAGRSYHHGALRDALLEAAEAVVAERGAHQFSLRECARRAGVSGSAPAHHFGDARGLLTALAAQGFERLGDALAGALASEAHRPVAAMGRAYLAFARSHGALFSVMWNPAMLDASDPAYIAAGRRAFALFSSGFSGQDFASAMAPHLPPAELIAAWSMLHGYASLASDGALAPLGDIHLDAVLSIAEGLSAR